MLNSILKVGGYLTIIIISTACAGKEDLTEIKTQVNQFKEEWSSTGSQVRGIIDSLKTNIDLVKELQKKIIKDNQQKNLSQNTKASLDGIASKAAVLADTMSLDIKKANEFIVGWNKEKNDLNELIARIDRKTISIDEASSKLEHFQGFRTNSINSLKNLRVNRDSLHANYQRLHMQYAQVIKPVK